MKLNPKHPALREERTIHTTRVYDPKGYKSSIFKSVAHNSKVGSRSNTIQKGSWKGLPMFALTLEERATCPPCIHKSDCYGNNSPFSHRFKPGINLEKRVQHEIPLLAFQHSRGFVVRLHILGDFYSPLYVALWKGLIGAYNGLRVFGYTAHRPSSYIGGELLSLNRMFPDRVRIRFSTLRDTGEPVPMAILEPSPDALTCPQMTGKTKSCCTCALCWESDKAIHFPSH